MRLLAASVGPFETWALCHAAIWSFQRMMVRPSDWTSGGHESSPVAPTDGFDVFDGKVEVDVGVDLAYSLPAGQYRRNPLLRFGGVRRPSIRIPPSKTFDCCSVSRVPSATVSYTH